MTATTLTTTTSVPNAARAQRAIGAMFFSVFGSLWLGYGAVVARGAVDATVAPIAVAGALLFATACLRWRANRAALAAQEETPQSRRAARVFHAVNTGQWILMIVLGNVLRNVGLGDWVVPMIIGVVGLHFLPLAVSIGYRAHYASGFALLALAAVYPFVAAAGPLSAAGPIGAGLILWASATFGLAAGAPAANDDCATRAA